MRFRFKKQYAKKEIIIKSALRFLYAVVGAYALARSAFNTIFWINHKDTVTFMNRFDRAGVGAIAATATLVFVNLKSHF